MHSVLDEIATLRKGKSIVVDRRNSNRYRLVTLEDDGTKTAYCFGVPIYNRQTRKLIDLRFCNDGGVWFADGSDAQICVGEDALLENGEGSCRISLPGNVTSQTERVIRCGASEIYPTANGLAFRVPYSADQPHEMSLSLNRPFTKVRTNDKYFALMSEEFRPFVTVSGIGVLDGSGRLIAPCTIRYQKNTDSEFTLTIGSKSPYGRYVLYEINLHEEKLFQDTTVESGNPRENNAFGGIAFLGDTATYGEQWLYSRLELSKIPEVWDRRIYKAILHLPKLTAESVALTAFGVRSRFCSFGSNWDNKVPMGEELCESESREGYQSLDITGLLTDHSTHYLTHSEGLILKTKRKGSGFTAVATGDSYYTPQILEINFR